MTPHRRALQRMLVRLERAERAAPAVLDVVGKALAVATVRECPVGQYTDAQGTPYEGGDLRASIRWEHTSGLTGYLVMDGVGRYVLYGTAPHVILPRRTRALRFVPRGGPPPVLTRVVHHPGTPANNFVLRAWTSDEGVQRAKQSVPLLAFTVG